MKLPISLLAAASLALSGCVTAPTPSEMGAVTFAGAVAGSLLKANVPEIVPFLPTIQGAIRSLSGVTPPTPAQVQAAVAQWTAALPVSAAAKAKTLAFVLQKYEDARPAIVRADHTALYLEAFVSAF